MKIKSKEKYDQFIQSSSALFPDLESDKKYLFLALWFLNMLSGIYYLIFLINLWLYKKGYRKITTLSMPVISIGNLTVGGTGKTPILIYLVELLKSQNKHMGIVSGNYKARSKDILKVTDDQRSDLTSGQRFGDEPLLIFQKTSVPVYIGPKKVETAKEIVRTEKIEMVIVDDGFQHLALKKNCNILLLDVTQMDDRNCLFPRGRYREPFSGYQNADIIFWTKTNFISEDHLDKLKKQVSFSGLQVDWSFSVSAVEFPESPNLNFEVRKLHLYNGKSEFQSIKRFVLVSAIARPEFFTRTVQELNPKWELIEKKFHDHHQYSSDDIKKILNKPINFHHFLTTEKDYTKLKDLWPKAVPLGIVKWDVRPNISDRNIYESIIECLH